jgi:hypothetical protein
MEVLLIITDVRTFIGSMSMRLFRFTKKIHCQVRALTELGAKTGPGTPLEHRQIETKKIT